MAHFVDYQNAYDLMSAIAQSSGGGGIIHMASTENNLVSIDEITIRMVEEGSTHAFAPIIGFNLTTEWCIGYKPSDYADNANCSFFFRKRAVDSDTWSETGVCARIAPVTSGDNTYQPYIYLKNAHIYRLSINNSYMWVITHDGLFVKSGSIISNGTTYGAQCVSLYDGNYNYRVADGSTDVEISEIITQTNLVGYGSKSANMDTYGTSSRTNIIMAGQYVERLWYNSVIIPQWYNAQNYQTENNGTAILDRILKRMEPSYKRGYEYGNVYEKNKYYWNQAYAGIQAQDIYLPVWGYGADIYV